MQSTHNSFQAIGQALALKIYEYGKSDNDLVMRDKLLKFLTFIQSEEAEALKYRDEKGRGLLQIAILANADELIDTLVALGSDVETDDAQGRNAFWYAAKKGAKRYLLSLGKYSEKGKEKQASPWFDSDKNGIPPYFIACQADDSILEIFLNYLRAEEKEERDIDIISLLEQRDVKGNTFLHYACKYNKKQAIESVINLIKASRLVNDEQFNLFLNQMNKDGFNCMHFAAERGNVELLPILIEHGLYDLAKDKEGLTAFEHLTDADLQLLVERGYFINKVISENLAIKLRELIDPFSPESFLITFVINDSHKKWRFLDNEELQSALENKAHLLLGDFDERKMVYIWDNLREICKETPELLQSYKKFARKVSIARSDGLKQLILASRHVDNELHKILIQGENILPKEIQDELHSYTDSIPPELCLVRNQIRSITEELDKLIQGYSPYTPTHLETILSKLKIYLTLSSLPATVGITFGGAISYILSKAATTSPLIIDENAPWKPASSNPDYTIFLTIGSMGIGMLPLAIIAALLVTKLFYSKVNDFFDPLNQQSTKSIRQTLLADIKNINLTYAPENFQPFIKSLKEIIITLEGNILNKDMLVTLNQLKSILTKLQKKLFKTNTPITLFNQSKNDVEHTSNDIVINIAEGDLVPMHETLDIQDDLDEGTPLLLKRGAR